MIGSCGLAVGAHPLRGSCGGVYGDGGVGFAPNSGFPPPPMPFGTFIICPVVRGVAPLLDWRRLWGVTPSWLAIDGSVWPRWTLYWYAILLPLHLEAECYRLQLDHLDVKGTIPLRIHGVIPEGLGTDPPPGSSPPCNCIMVLVMSGAASAGGLPPAAGLKPCPCGIMG